MKNLIYSLFCTSLFFTGCASAHTNESVYTESLPIVSHGEPAKIIVATDLHYIASTLSNDSSYLSDMMANGDGKMTIYIEEIVDAFISEVITEQPDALVLTGDVSFNGAKESHIELVQKLETIQHAGIPVITLSGNHDIAYRQAAKFEDDSFTHVDNISTQEFIQLYAPLQESHILSTDLSSSSFTTLLRDDLWLIGIDSNTEDFPNEVSFDTLDWLEKQLQLAHEQDIKVITLTHQNILPHNPLFTEGFVIKNASEIVALLEAYDVSVNLSGHMHAQHIAQKDTLYDLALSSLAVSPLQYAILTVDTNHQLNYTTQSVDVSTWAQNTQQTDQNLLNFAEYAKMYFISTSYVKLVGQLNDLPLSIEQKQNMLTFATSLNHDYFAGILTEDHPAILNTEAINLWQEYGKTLFFSQYLQSILDTERNNYNQFSIQL